MDIPWKTKGIVLTAPKSEDVDIAVRFIEEYLAPRGCNLIVLQIRYRYQFKKHPECVGFDPLSESDIKKLVSACKRHNIKLVPKMNLHGHQSGLPNDPDDSILHGHPEKKADIRDGLLRAYPEFDEQYGEREVIYSRSLCVTNPLVKIILFDLIDELLEVFEADTIHIGCDEVISIGICEECKKYSNAELFSNYVNEINEHIKSRGAKTMIWADRLYSTEQTGYFWWDSSENKTENAIKTLSKDIILCDWHYEPHEKYPSVDILADAGFRFFICPWRNHEGTEAFIKYAREHNRENIEGILVTTWCNLGELARVILDGADPIWRFTLPIAQTLYDIFGK